LKEKATTHVVAQYKLQAGCKTLIAALLAGWSYIFPGDECTWLDRYKNFHWLLLAMYIPCSHLQYKRVHHTVTQSLQLSMPKCSSKLRCPLGTYILITSPTRLRMATLANAKSPRQCWS
jgi:hypothetical protein